MTTVYELLLTLGLKLGKKDRKQFTYVNWVESSETLIKCGVSQGSVLWLLLFQLYINEIPNAVH